MSMKIIHGTGAQFDVEQTASRRLLEDILSRPLFAHLATSSEHGPRESPVWFLWEAEALWIIGGYTIDSFPKRLEKEPRCAIGIVDFDSATGLVQHVGLRGRAHLELHDEDRMKRLLRRYLGENEPHWDPRFLAVLGDPEWVLICFKPETVVVRDQSYRVSKEV
jgi:hypothetical protein